MVLVTVKVLGFFFSRFWKSWKSLKTDMVLEFVSEGPWKCLNLIFTARCTIHSAKRGLAIACRPSVCLSVRPSVMLVICDHIGWKSWKLTAQAISPTPSLFAAGRGSTYS